MKKIIIVDGNSLAFSRMPKSEELKNEMYRSKETSEDIYIVRKFFKKLLKYKYQFFPGYKIVVVFDEPNKFTFRHELFSKYKSKKISESRKQQKDYVYEQIEVIKRRLTEMGIANYSSPNWEADDIIGMLLKRMGNKYYSTIVTGDKDLIQLVSDKTRIAFLNENRNIKVYDRTNIWEISGEVWPDQIIGVKVLAGDKSDNIKGLGIKRNGIIDRWTQDEAVEHLVKYKTLDNLIKNADKLEEPFRSSLVRGKEKVELRRKLIELCTDWKIDLDYEKFINTRMIPEQIKRNIEDLNLESITKNNKRIKNNLLKEGIEW